jgi:ubiquinone/menaquinone biosynthesis C-methylase UbiE
MDVRAATSLIAGAVPQSAGTWADLGAGSGTFTIALAKQLPRGSSIIAIDQDAAALEVLRARAQKYSLGAAVATRVGNFRTPLDVPQLNGVLMANALHFVPYREQTTFLATLGDQLQNGGRVIVVEYDGRRASPWVPYPVARSVFSELCTTLGWSAPTFVGSRPSRYGGAIYAAYSDLTKVAQQN